MAARGDLYWPTAYVLQGQSDPKTEVDIGSNYNNESNGDEDQNYDYRIGAGMNEGDGDNDDVMDYGGAIIPDQNHTVEVDMAGGAFILQPTHYEDNPPSEPEAIEQATAEPPVSPALLHPGLAPAIHQPPGPGPMVALAPDTHTDTLVQLQQQIADANEIIDDNELNSNHPILLSDPNTISLESGNPGVVYFLRDWILESQMDNISRATREVPIPIEVRDLARHIPRWVTYEELEGDNYDFQGIDWKTLGISKNQARNRRFDMYCNYVNKKDSDIWLVSRKCCLAIM